MKTIFTLTTTLLTLAGTAQAHTIPNGAFRGDGIWRSAKSHGAYAVTTDVAGDHIRSVYKWSDDKSISSELELRSGPNGFLRVFSHDREVGSGYCLEKVPVCHFELKAGKISLEETLSFEQGKLYTFGSKMQDGVKVQWQERLEK